MKKDIREAYNSATYDNVAERMAESIQSGSYYCLFGDYCDWAGVHGWEFLTEDYEDDLPWEPCLQEAKDELDALLEDGYDLIVLDYVSLSKYDYEGQLADFLALDDNLLPAVPKRPYSIEALRERLPFCKEFLDATLTKKKVNWLVAAEYEGQKWGEAVAEAFEAAIANSK